MSPRQDQSNGRQCCQSRNSRTKAKTAPFFLFSSLFVHISLFSFDALRHKRFWMPQKIEYLKEKCLFCDLCQFALWTQLIRFTDGIFKECMGIPSSQLYLHCFMITLNLCFLVYICMCLYVFLEEHFNRFHFLFFEKLNARQPVFKFWTDSIRQEVLLNLHDNLRLKGSEKLRGVDRVKRPLVNFLC